MQDRGFSIRRSFPNLSILHHWYPYINPPRHIRVFRIPEFHSTSIGQLVTCGELVGVARSRQGARAAAYPDRVSDADREALQWLTVDELAARRRALVRDYDRELRSEHPDSDRVAAIWAEADAIEQVQRGRRPH